MGSWKRNWKVMTGPKICSAAPGHSKLTEQSSVRFSPVGLLLNVHVSCANWVQMLTETADEVSVESHTLCFSFVQSWFQFAPWMWDKVIWIFGAHFLCYTPCVCVTGHKQAGMFLLEDFQEAPTIWLALWGFPPSCYIYCMYVSAWGIGFWFAMFPIDTTLRSLLNSQFWLFC